MDGGDYADGITKAPIVIDNVKDPFYVEYIRDLESSKQDLVERKCL